MRSAVKSIVWKTNNALDEVHANKKMIVEVKKECVEDIEMLNENLENCNNIVDQMEVTTAIAEMHGLRYKMIDMLQSNLNGDNIPSTSSISNCGIFWKDIKSAFGNCIQTGVMVNRDHIDPKRFLDNCCNVLKAKVDDAFKIEVSLKINTIFSCELKLIKDEEEKFVRKCVDTKSASLLKYDDFKNWYAEHIVQPILNSLEELQEHESGWTLSAVIDLRVNINKHTMLLGSSFVDLPNEIKVKKACVNVHNNDEACFAWAVVSAIYPIKSGSNRMNNYPHYEKVLQLNGIQFPMTINQIPHFERQNNMSINVFSLKLNTEKRTNDKYMVVPTYVSRDVKDTHLNLMLIQNNYLSEDRSEYEDYEQLRPVKYHYVWIKHLSRLLSSQLSGHKSQKYICNRCLHYFSSPTKLTEHIMKCSVNNIKICLPKNEIRDIEFKNYSKKKKAPFVIYAGLQCLFNEMKSGQKRVPCNISYYVKCSYDPTLSFYRFHRGEDCISWFTRELEQFADDVGTVFICDYPKSRMTVVQKIVFNDTNNLCLCYVCQKPFTKSCKRVPCHCRFTGMYRGPAHEICNMNFRDSHTIPVFFHNLTDFDSHLLIKHFENYFEGRININMLKKNESFITFTKHMDGPIKFRFIDSFQFMSGTLDTLASNLTAFPVLRSEMSHLTDTQFELLTKKTVYPDSYINSLANFLETSLPPISEFGDITQVDYEHANKVWNEFMLRNLGEYSDLCLKTDVLLLADVFEEFRDKCIEKYELDPSYYHTLSAFTWDVMLKQTNVSLELLTDMDMVTFIERGTRHGLSQCSLRYSKANNMYLKDYIYTKPSKYLMHFDVNNQCSWAMSQNLPYGKFQWVEDLNNFDVETVPDDSLIGYILEVDLEYPRDIHDLHKDLPFCPEYQIAPDLKPQEKLMATLHNKVNYVIHYRNLKQALNHGLILTKIHRILQFEQSPWLKSYIDLNRYFSLSARNNFERNLFELMNYIVFEKFVENIRLDCNLKLVSKWEGRYGAEAQISKPEFWSSTIISEKLAVFKLNLTEIYLSKPIYVGMCILDLAKTRIYDFHYQYMQKKFGQYCAICYIDTDSVLYEITSINVYDSVREDCEQKFDTSDYPYDNIWNIPKVNSKALGLIKDRNNGRVISEFIGFRSKMYAVKLDDRVKPIPLKGIDKEIVARRISFEDYANCLVNETQTESLSLQDSKRHIKENRCETLPWGHYSLS